MPILQSVHHINFLVRDLERAVRDYESLLDLGPFEFEELPERSVMTARVRVGDVWIVLVAPQRPDSDVGRYLQTHGEGFLLLSFGVDNLREALADLSGRGAVSGQGNTRRGIDGWQVADLATEDQLGVRLHVTER